MPQKLPKNISAPDDQRNLRAQFVNFGYLFGNFAQHFSIYSISYRPHQRFAAQLEQYSSVNGFLILTHQGYAPIITRKFGPPRYSPS